MLTVFSSNDPIEINFAKSVLSDIGIPVLLSDVYTSIMEGSIGAIPVRIMVTEENYAHAHAALSDNGLVDEQ